MAAPHKSQGNKRSLKRSYSFETRLKLPRKSTTLEGRGQVAQHKKLNIQLIEGPTMRLKSFIYCTALALTLVFASAASQVERRDNAGALFTMDNATAANHVLAYSRGADGSVSPLGMFATDGTGTLAAGWATRAHSFSVVAAGGSSRATPAATRFPSFALRLTDCHSPTKSAREVDARSASRCIEICSTFCSSTSRGIRFKSSNRLSAEKAA